MEVTKEFDYKILQDLLNPSVEKREDTKLNWLYVFFYKDKQEQR